jgi:hypothetical protein
LVAIFFQFDRMKRVLRITAAALSLTLTCAITIFASPTTIVVTNTNDNGPGSLRQALVDANKGDTIDATGISGVITLTTGELLVDKRVTINGAGADAFAIDGNAASVVFFIFRNASGETVTISGLTIRNGKGGSFGVVQHETSFLGSRKHPPNRIASHGTAKYLTDIRPLWICGGSCGSCLRTTQTKKARSLHPSHCKSQTRFYGMGNIATHTM